MGLTRALLLAGVSTAIMANPSPHSRPLTRLLFGPRRLSAKHASALVENSRILFKALSWDWNRSRVNRTSATRCSSGTARLNGRCHSGPGTEAGTGLLCEIRRRAPGQAADVLFNWLLDACEALAPAGGVARPVAGVIMAPRGLSLMLVIGFRTQLQGLRCTETTKSDTTDPAFT